MAPAITRSRVVDSPIGPLTLGGTDEVLMHLCMHEQAHAPADRAQWPRSEGAFGDVVELLNSYFAGERVDMDVKLHLQGTSFQQEVCQALREIPHGETWSYGKLAAHIGRPSASRAVGLAVGRNPIAIVVPCHRVVGADGSLTGFAGGLERKRALLDLERRARP
ncbi:MAG: methylated-DNA--[protein]-cysteine S-methyltransferase [Acidimicrobiales bacterium]